MCSCPGPPLPGCCPSGWQTVYCGSRFCTPAESRYHPIEGEACAAINGLDKCRAFVLGNPDLIMVLDHKPLLKVLGRAQLDEVLNLRLMNFKLRSLAYRFQPNFVPGKKHVVPDAFSRRSDNPDPPPPSPTKSPVTMDNTNVLPAYKQEVGPPSWVSPPSKVDAFSIPTQQEIDVSYR